MTPRGCNYPYRGYKNTLFEGGTLSPTLVYSTKKRLPNQVLENLVHITDWMPTIMDLAGYRGKLKNELDGVSQKILFEKPAADFKDDPPRDKFIYGLINHWDEMEEKWVTHYGVRYNKWKFLNFRRENFGHYKCEEGWKNDKHMKYLFPSKKSRDSMTKKLEEIAELPNLPRSNTRKPGFSLFNLKWDPLELLDLNREGKKSFWKEHLELVVNIQTYVAEEMQKGRKYPITGTFYSIVSF